MWLRQIYYPFPVRLLLTLGSSSFDLDSWDLSMISYASYPAYFDKYGRKEPKTMNHVPITVAGGHAEMNFYEMISSNPAQVGIFMKAMNNLEEKMPICGSYDFTWLIAEARKQPERTVFVYIGGGMGHAIRAVHTEFPDLPLSRCVLQDRAEIIEAMKALDEPVLRDIQTMVIDFHESQPVKGTKISFL